MEAAPTSRPVWLAATEAFLVSTVHTTLPNPFQAWDDKKTRKSTQGHRAGVIVYESTHIVSVSLH